MTDLVGLTFQAGQGGDGKVSFRREKYIPKGGPDGGDGGDGGNVILRASSGKSSLNHLSGVKVIKAESGQGGMGKKKTGHKGSDQVVEVPIGTQVWLLAESETAKKRWERSGLKPVKRRDAWFNLYEQDWHGQQAETTGNRADRTRRVGDDWLVPSDAQPIRSTREKGMVLAELLTHGQEVIICQGGFGGRGNVHFKSAAETTPLKAERGSWGEKRRVILELKLLADIGLLGLPSVGKSTLLSALTPAHPKIGAYPFTTLQPHLGIYKNNHIELIIADIPGLIAGASLGKGLGLDFLRHVEHCRILVFVLALEEVEALDEEQSPTLKADLLIKQYQTLMEELDNYSYLFKQKDKLVVVNKIDLYPAALRTAISQVFKHQLGLDPIQISAYKHQGLEYLTNQLIACSQHPSILQETPKELVPGLG